MTFWIKDSCFLNMFYLLLLIIIISKETCFASIRKIGTITPGFVATQMSFIDNDGLFLLSNSSKFAFGFVPQKDNPTLFHLSVVHKNTATVIWSANRASPVGNSDEFTFDEGGTVGLKNGDGITVWSADVKGVVAMELWDSGNLVLLGGDVSNGGNVIWQSFSFPTDTLLQSQNFSDGMKLVSDPSPGNLSYSLQIESGDMMLYVGYSVPQPYWSLRKDTRKIMNTAGGDDVGISSASIDSSSWNFFDRNGDLVWQYSVVGVGNPNGTWIAVLGNVGSISFTNLPEAGSNLEVSDTTIPMESCGKPEACHPYQVCSDRTTCGCPSSLSSWNCDLSRMMSGSCDGSMELVEVGDRVNYFALGFVSPFSKTSLDGCKSSCLGNCSCVALFFRNSTGNCYTFDRVGSFRESDGGFVSFVKVNAEGGGGGSGSKRFPYVVIITVVACFLVVSGLVFVGYYYVRIKNARKSEELSSSEDNNLFGNLSGMPGRFSYRELQTATENFSVKLGQGGFGSVYKGVLTDGTRIAVKKLEGIGQGKKEFRAEVSIIGSIHHLHLVRLKGFCAEGPHRLLAYEFMANGSLDKWIFKRKNDDFLLNWDTRFNIALGTAKGLAYLHDDCDVKIVHCDIKPENVLLDDNYNAKVSDFGLAKLMSREQSHVYTTLRGTRGYLAPEWITNYAISEKSDVYSYGMVLLELIGGRKNFDPTETSEKSHFPSFAFKMMEEGKVNDIWDSRLSIKENDERVATAIRVALWCIQDDMNLRPSMTKVVQMLEGLCPVSIPPVASPLGSRLYFGMLKSMSGEGTSSGASVPSDQYNSDAHISAVRLSGPR